MDEGRREREKGRKKDRERERESERERALLVCAAPTIHFLSHALPQCLNI